MELLSTLVVGIAILCLLVCTLGQFVFFASIGLNALKKVFGYLFACLNVFLDGLDTLVRRLLPGTWSPVNTFLTAMLLLLFLDGFWTRHTLWDLGLLALISSILYCRSSSKRAQLAPARNSVSGEEQKKGEVIKLLDAQRVRPTETDMLLTLCALVIVGLALIAVAGLASRVLARFLF